MTRYYETTHANVHRGVYATAEESTALYERARVVTGRFIGAPDPAHEVVFTKNTTESLNLVAHAWGRANLRAGDAVLLTEMEHHANIVPWMILSEEVGGLDIRYIPIDADGRLVLDDLDTLIDGVKVVGISTMSNVLGTINPVSDIAEVAHRAGALVKRFVEGAHGEEESRQVGERLCADNARQGAANEVSADSKNAEAKLGSLERGFEEPACGVRSEEVEHPRRSVEEVEGMSGGRGVQHQQLVAS